MTTPDSLPPVAELLPHGPQSCFLESLLSLDQGGARARVVAGGSPLYLEPDGVPAVVALEYMAQTSAAFLGTRRRQGGLPVQIGFLVGCRTLTLEVAHFARGEVLEVEVRLTGTEGPLARFACRVLRGGESVATGELSVFSDSNGGATP